MTDYILPFSVIMDNDDEQMCVWGQPANKQSKKGKHVAPTELMAYGYNSHLRAVSTLKEYFPRTKDVRDTDQRFISYQKPGGPVSKHILARWNKDTLNRAGVNSTLFTAHSTRSASISAAG